MANFFSKDSESQYNLIKMHLSDKTTYSGTIEAVNKDISYLLIDLKKKLEKENIFL